MNVEETDWEKKTYPILLEENLMLYKLIDELYKQINWLNEAMERHYEQLREDHRSFMHDLKIEQELSESDLEGWVDKYLIKRRGANR